MSSQAPYAVRWRRLWSVVIAACVAVSPLVVGLVDALCVAAVGAGIAAVAAGVLVKDEGLALAPGLAWFGRRVLWGAGGLLAVSTVGAFSSLLLLWLLVAAGLSSPPLRAAVAGTRDRLLGPVPEATVPVPLSPPGVDSLAGMSNFDLCQVWRSTHRYLQDVRSPVELAACARLRRRVIEELELRHPDAVAAWLSTGAHAAEGPEAFLPWERRDNAS